VKDDLVRFGVAMEHSLLEDFDRIVEARGVTRSEVLRDLVRAEVVRDRTAGKVPAVASLTLVYDHHVRELTEKLTELQHQLGDKVRATLHVHLDEDRCLEVIVLRGRSDELKAFSERLLATRGVTHGGLEIVTEEAGARAAHGHEHRPGHRHRR
jgi:CopG family nickel-responsive transcriptional regulator